MNEELIKSLTDLIDETLHELDELKKSSKYTATEVKLDGPGESLNAKNVGGDKSADGGIDGVKKEEKEEKSPFEPKEEPKEGEKDEDEDEKKKKAKKDAKPEMKEEKDEKPAFMKEEDEKHEEHEKKESKSEEKKEHEAPAGEPEKKEEPKGEDHYFKLFKKHEQEMNDLTKSVIDSRVAPLEQKLETVLELVNKIAGQPNAPKGVSARDVVPLNKSEDNSSLAKGEIADKLFALKKSGTVVASEDFVKIDLGQDLENIVKKYNLK